MEELSLWWNLAVMLPYHEAFRRGFEVVKMESSFQVCWQISEKNFLLWKAKLLPHILLFTYFEQKEFFSKEQWTKLEVQYYLQSHGERNGKTHIVFKKEHQSIKLTNEINLRSLSLNGSCHVTHCIWISYVLLPKVSLVVPINLKLKQNN